jgi:hypothetical protein
MMDLLRTIAPKIERINNFNYVESVVKIKNKTEFTSLVNLLEKYYLTAKSVSVLAAFLPEGMIASFHVGRELTGLYDQKAITDEIFRDYLKLADGGRKPLAPEKAKDFFFAQARRHVQAGGQEKG